jgi:hypothetical protein
LLTTGISNSCVRIWISRGFANRRQENVSNMKNKDLQKAAIKALIKTVV